MKKSATLIFFIATIFLSSCGEDSNQELTDNTSQPCLVSFKFIASKNPDVLIEDIEGKIIGDSVVECWVPYLVPHKKLIADVTALGDVKLNNIDINLESICDYSQPVIMILSKNDQSKTYKIYVYSFTGLPVLYIDTENRAIINSVEDYIPATFKLEENVVTRGAGDVTEGSLNIRGRGNSTWSLPKKPYRLKLDDKISLFGEAKNKHWALLANHYDNTMLRNALAFYMGSLSNLQYTPKSHFVELFLNGHYNGTYQLTETIRIDENRLNIGDDGFLLEIDGNVRSDEINFKTPKLAFPIRIHKPEVTYEDERYTYIRDYVLEAENVLFSDNFLDKNTGYKTYFDIKSFAEWYIITEILESPEASNGYMNKTHSGKLCMGPLWDYDMALGNVIPAEFGYPALDWTYMFAREQKWLPYFKRMFQDPEFTNLVKERFEFFYSQKEKFINFINENASYLSRSIIENNNRWNILYKNQSYLPNSGISVWGCYFNEVQYLKQFLINRFEAIKEELKKY